MTLIAKNLTCARAHQTLFAPVDFSLRAGAAMLLQGPNGIGKTTLLRSLAGLGPAPAGEVTLNGTPLAGQEGALAYAGHQDAIKHSLTVRENIDFWARLSGSGQVDEALELFHLTELADRLAGRMSAGQKRRLGLARLAVTPAPLWLLDEPTVSLDTENTRRLAALITRHLDGGGMALIATHVPIPVAAEVLLLEAFTLPPAPDPFLDGPLP